MVQPCTITNVYNNCKIINRKCRSCEEIQSQSGILQQRERKREKEHSPFLYPLCPTDAFSFAPGESLWACFAQSFAFFAVRWLYVYIDRSPQRVIRQTGQRGVYTGCRFEGNKTKAEPRQPMYVHKIHFIGFQRTDRSFGIHICFPPTDFLSPHPFLPHPWRQETQISVYLLLPRLCVWGIPFVSCVPLISDTRGTRERVHISNASSTFVAGLLRKFDFRENPRLPKIEERDRAERSRKARISVNRRRELTNSTIRRCKKFTRTSMKFLIFQIFMVMTRIMTVR